MYSVFSVAFLFAAPMISDKFVGVALTPVSELLMRGNGAMVLVPAAICYCMQVRPLIVLTISYTLSLFMVV